MERFRLPAWMQVVKLGAEWLVRKASSALVVIGRFFYTAYVVLIGLLLLLPVYISVSFSSQETAIKICQHAARWLIHLMFCRLVVHDRKNLTAVSPVIFAANHASYFDALVVLAIMPSHTRIVGKKELLTTPILGTFMRKLGFLAVDRQDLSKGIEDTREIEVAIKSNHSIFIFPEGTFSYASGLRPFRLGAFKIAAETNTPVCPVAFRGTRFILREGERTMSPGRIVVTACAPIKPQGTEWEDIIALRQAVRADIARFCGEPSLDFIVAQTVAPKFKNMQ